MKIGSHKAITASVAVFMGVPVTGIVIMVIGGILPDIIEMTIAMRNDKLFKKNTSNYKPLVGPLAIVSKLYLYYAHANCFRSLYW